MYKPKNVDDYVELINQALFEVDDLILCAEDEGESDAEFSTMMPELRAIEAGLKALHAEILGGGLCHRPGRGPAIHAGGAEGAQAPADRELDRRHQQRT